MPLPDTQASEPKSVAFRTVGCRLNQCETAQMQEAVLARGYRLVPWDQPADIRVINTCTVTSKSDKTCRNEIRSAKRLDPGCIIAVTGCYAQVAPDTVAAIPGVDLVLGNTDKLRLAEYLAQMPDRDRFDGGRAAGDRGSRPHVAVSPHGDDPGFEAEPVFSFNGYTRAFLKIQTGCDSQCAYCVIPLARGRARSMHMAQVLEQVRLLASRGYREVVLTGIDLGSWGRDSREGSLADLLQVLLARGGAGRYRLSSIEPLEMDGRLQGVIDEAGDRMAHHFHLPLQSGSDSVLERMSRPYTAAQYLEVVTRLADRFPDAALGADVIVGFPGETDREFEETLAFIEHSPLTYLHVFTYSDRPGTAASAMRPKVHPETIRERSMRVRASGTRKKEAFQARLAGSEQRALVLRERSPDGRLVGLTGNYQEPLLKGDDDLVNRFVRVRLTHVLPDGRWEADLLHIEEPA